MLRRSVSKILQDINEQLILFYTRVTLEVTQANGIVYSFFFIEEEINLEFRIAGALLKSTFNLFTWFLLGIISFILRGIVRLNTCHLPILCSDINEFHCPVAFRTKTLGCNRGSNGSKVFLNIQFRVDPKLWEELIGWSNGRRFSPSEPFSDFSAKF